MTSSIVTASALSSPRNTIARLSPTRSASTPQLSKILANAKSYAVSIVIGGWRAFIRAKSGTRTLSWVMFGFKSFSRSKKIGTAASATPYESELAKASARYHSESRSPTSDPGASSRYVDASAEEAVTSQTSRRKKNLLDGQIAL